MLNLIKILTNRVIIVAVLVVIQFAFIIAGVFFLSDSIYLNTSLMVISILVVIYIINKPANPSYKLAWIIPILIFPVFGGLFYLIFGGRRVGKHLKTQAIKIDKETINLLKQDPDIMKELKSSNPSAYSQASYLVTPHKGVGIDESSPSQIYPIYKNTETEYLSPGETFYERLIAELSQAKHFIYMEYFIIEEGFMWDTILNILTKKASEGVDVRIIYDDFGCIMKLPMDYPKTLAKRGVKCRKFNPIRAHLLKVPLMNNRDHRKITVIDGHTGFTGGINLADEYMNVTHPFGYWKDSAVMLRGEAVWSLTVMFMQMWNLCGPYEKFQYSRYAPYIHSSRQFKSDGYVLPYSDSPMDNEIQAEMVYLNMINKATKYIYISTPYLIIDNELATALMLAAKNGVDVRIVTPHKYDKWYVHMCTQANYTELVKAGVKIYEYAPGFIHSKTFVCDDEIATIGTVNLDYRSLYLHFECGTFLYKSKAVKQLKEDYMYMLKDCIEMTEAKCTNVNIFKRVFRSIIRVFSPLL
ncbi:MAG: cardiolipin synthase [Firmicutes bacterium]|nr:cardiolipin synthase [Bacillota bacterium]